MLSSVYFQIILSSVYCGFISVSLTNKFLISTSFRLNLISRCKRICPLLPAATFVPGESLYHCNDVTTRIYLIEKGSAKVYSPIDMIGNGLSKEEIDKKLGETIFS